MRIDNNCKYLINKVDCVSISIHKACQKALLLLSSNKASVHIQNLIIIGAKYMAVIYSKGITAVNLNVNSYLFGLRSPFWMSAALMRNSKISFGLTPLYRT